MKDKTENGTAIFNLMKELNTCKQQGAKTDAGYSDGDGGYLTNSPFDIYQTITAAAPAGRKLQQAPAAPAPSGPSLPCDISHDEAIEMFTKFHEETDICFFTKLNSPFSCVKKGPPPLLQRFSLSYANALLFQSILSAVVVQVFFKIMGKKTDDAEAAAEAEIAVVRETEAGTRK